MNKKLNYQLLSNFIEGVYGKEKLSSLIDLEPLLSTPREHPSLILPLIAPEQAVATLRSIGANLLYREVDCSTELQEIQQLIDKIISEFGINETLYRVSSLG